MQSLERELYGNIASIREVYENDAAITDMDVSKRFRQSGVVCAGSFVFYHCGRAWPLHPSTKEELYAFLICARRLGTTLPEHCARRIGELVQWSELARDYAERHMDIDVFVSEHDDLNALFPQWGEWRNNLADNPPGFSSIPSKFIDVLRFREIELRGHKHPHLSLQLLLLLDLNTTPLKFLHAEFDAEFCKNNFHDGRLEIVCADMIGEIHVQKYLELAQEIFDLSAYEYLASVRETLQERLEKYERRRFTITNAHEVREFIAQLATPCRFLNFTE